MTTSTAENQSEDYRGVIQIFMKSFQQSTVGIIEMVISDENNFDTKNHYGGKRIGRWMFKINISNTGIPTLERFHSILRTIPHMKQWLLL